MGIFNTVASAPTIDASKELEIHNEALGIDADLISKIDKKFSDPLYGGLEIMNEMETGWFSIIDNARDTEARLVADNANVDTMNEAEGGFWASIKAFFVRIWNAIKSWFKQAMNWVTSKFMASKAFVTKHAAELKKKSAKFKTYKKIYSISPKSAMLVSIANKVNADTGIKTQEQYNAAVEGLDTVVNDEIGSYEDLKAKEFGEESEETVAGSSIITAISNIDKRIAEIKKYSADAEKVVSKAIKDAEKAASDASAKSGGPNVSDEAGEKISASKKQLLISQFDKKRLTAYLKVLNYEVRVLREAESELVRGARNVLASK